MTKSKLTPRQYEPMRFVLLAKGPLETLEESLLLADIQRHDLEGVREIASRELDPLEQLDCARYNLPRRMTKRWIEAARPR